MYRGDENVLMLLRTYDSFKQQVLLACFQFSAAVAQSGGKWELR